LGAFDRVHREGVDVRTAVTARTRNSLEASSPHKAPEKIARSPVGTWMRRLPATLRKAGARFPARAKKALRPHLVPLRRFMLAPVEQEMRQLRSQVEQLGASQRVVIPTGDGDVLVRTVVGWVLCGADDTLVLASLIDGGELERGTRKLIERLVKPGDVFVDVGAHLGLHTLAAGNAMQRSGSIHAYEPFRESARRLRAAVELNGMSHLVTVRETALSNGVGTGTLYLGQVSGHHSLYPLAENQAADAPPADVQLNSLDIDLADVAHADVIKIDAEGAEMAIVQGADALIERSPEVALIVELGPSHLSRVGVSLEEWFASFEARGLVFRVIDPETGHLTQRAMSTLREIDSVNLLFARPDAQAWLRAGKG
jgi:FkbM family methyltransferase